MAFQVSQTDTGQFVLMDPATETVIIDDDLAVGFARLERAVADKPAKPASTTVGPAASVTQGSTAFSFVGGPRYTPVLLAVVLPFAWLAVLYLALANLLSEHALDRSSAGDTQTKIQALEREVQALRSEIAGAPRTAKQKPKPPPKPKPAADAAAKPEPAEQPGADDARAKPAVPDGGDEDDGREVEPTLGLR
jgi:hypothetical protein